MEVPLENSYVDQKVALIQIQPRVQGLPVSPFPTPTPRSHLSFQRAIPALRMASYHKHRGLLARGLSLAAGLSLVAPSGEDWKSWGFGPRRNT